MFQKQKVIISETGVGAIPIIVSPLNDKTVGWHFYKNDKKTHYMKILRTFHWISNVLSHSVQIKKNNSKIWSVEFMILQCKKVNFVTFEWNLQIKFIRSIKHHRKLKLSKNIVNHKSWVIHDNMKIFPLHGKRVASKIKYVVEDI